MEYQRRIGDTNRELSIGNYSDYYQLVYPIGITNTNYIDSLFPIAYALSARPGPGPAPPDLRGPRGRPRVYIYIYIDIHIYKCISIYIYTYIWRWDIKYYGFVKAKHKVTNENEML